MLGDAQMDELLARIEPYREEDLGPARALRYVDVLDAVSQEWDLEGQEAYAALTEWVKRRGGDIEYSGAATPLVLFPDPPGDEPTLAEGGRA